MALSSKKAILLAALESVSGTPETLVVGDGGLAITDISYSPDIKLLPRNIISSTFGQLAAVPGAKSASVNFTTELKGGGAAGTAPLLGIILQMCGFTETVNAAVDVQYALANTGLQTGTMAYDLQDAVSGNGPRFSIFGAMGNPTFAANVGEFATVSVDMLGGFTAVTDVAPLSPTIETLAPPVFQNGTFTIGGVALKVRSFSLSPANQLALIPDINAASGYDRVAYVDRAPTFSFVAELEKVSVHNFMGLIEAGTESALVISTAAVAGNTVRIDATKLQYTTPTLGETDGIPTISMQGQLNKGGTNELLITVS